MDLKCLFDDVEPNDDCPGGGSHSRSSLRREFSIPFSLNRIFLWACSRYANTDILQHEIFESHGDYYCILVSFDLPLFVSACMFAN